jgi:hypothetical protein
MGRVERRLDAMRGGINAIAIIAVGAFTGDFG